MHTRTASRWFFDAAGRRIASTEKGGFLSFLDLMQALAVKKVIAEELSEIHRMIDDLEQRSQK